MTVKEMEFLRDQLRDLVKSYQGTQGRELRSAKREKVELVLKRIWQLANAGQAKFSNINKLGVYGELTVDNQLPDFTLTT